MFSKTRPSPVCMTVKLKNKISWTTDLPLHRVHRCRQRYGLAPLCRPAQLDVYGCGYVKNISTRNDTQRRAGGGFILNTAWWHIDSAREEECTRVDCYLNLYYTEHLDAKQSGYAWNSDIRVCVRGFQVSGSMNCVRRRKCRRQFNT